MDKRKIWNRGRMKQPKELLKEKEKTDKINLKRKKRKKKNK